MWYAGIDWAIEHPFSTTSGQGKGIFPCPFTVESLEYSEHQKEIRKLIVPGNSTLTSPHEYQPHSCSRRSIAKN
jgi:hypothetical protein